MEMFHETLMDIQTVVIILIVMFVTYIWLRSCRQQDLPPGPTMLPIFWNILTFKFSGGDLRKVTQKCSKDNGPF